jgi:2-oxoglutarate dehydrogenase E2 component (dihydrolipoamide succinyltransferase)
LIAPFLTRQEVKVRTMATEVKVPSLGESVTEATIAQWMKKVGDTVKVDEPLCELETDKVTVEVNAPAGGVLVSIDAPVGATVDVGALLAVIDASATASAPAAAKAEPAAAPAKAEPAPASAAPKAEPAAAPAARKLAADNAVDLASVPASGPKGHVLKEDVQAALAKPATPAAAAAPAPSAAPAPTREAGEREEKVRMTRLRQTIARRLKEAQNSAAMLTTFNDIDMSGVIALRNEYKDSFEKRHGVKLGFMSFFLKAAVAALKEIPAVNAEISGDSIIYKNYYDISVAVGGPQGLVTPVVRDADLLSFAGIEKTIGDFGRKARDGKLTMNDMSGGTFTISNGGVYGSLMSTPILNPPQSGILGMHKTQDRPVAIAGKVEIRPMMYVALSYDHRIVDGKEAVTFLVRIKEAIEDPRRLLLDM